jgi:glycosyltransferase involved in cell wall biosynthesis
MNGQPLVSVLMTAYNRENYIGEAIESVLNSTYPNLELIIVDDVSKDRTVEIARSYAAKDARVSVFVNEKNLGDYPNRNKAASYAKGDFIMYCDSDDSLKQDGIHNCVTAMALHPEVPFAMYWAQPAASPFVLSSAEALHQHFFKSPFLIMGPGGTIIKRSFFEEIKGYPVKYGPANDMYFNLKCPALAPILMLPFEFVNYRRHDGQELNNNNYSYLYNNYIYLNDALKELPMNLLPSEADWIGRKNKRRFFVNLLRFGLKTRDPKKIKDLLVRTRFGYRDIFKAIFQ